MGVLRTVVDMKKYARERGMPLRQKMKRENIKNLLVKICYAEEEDGVIYEKHGPYRRIFKLRRDLVDFARSYYIYEGQNANKKQIHDLLLKNNLVEIIEEFTVEKESPVCLMTSKVLVQVIANNDRENILA